VAGALDAGHRRMVGVDEGEVDDDLVRDMTELMTSLRARLYGRRPAAHRGARAVHVATTGGSSDGCHCDVGAGEVSSAAAPPAEKQAPKERFEVPDGWIPRGFTFEALLSSPPIRDTPPSSAGTVATSPRRTARATGSSGASEVRPCQPCRHQRRGEHRGREPALAPPGHGAGPGNRPARVTPPRAAAGSSGWVVA
jgi:hypothetical protein